ncbi:MAG TPA: DUF402 domain-containing protein [Pyrinomonadaceae bacterium]|nr:DUF402 domain-containing protein [Pyrinomonadaceae bacterium]
MKKSNSITVNSRKYDGTLSRSWECEVISRAEHAIKLRGVFAKTVEHRELGTIDAGTVSVEYFSADLWFNVFRFESPNGEFRNLYANICIPPKISDRRVDYVDLDIDVVSWPDGRVVVLDEKEFEENRYKFKYPKEVMEKVKATIALLIEAKSPNSWLSHFMP